MFTEWISFINRPRQYNITQFVDLSWTLNNSAKLAQNEIPINFAGIYSRNFHYLLYYSFISFIKFLMIHKKFNSFLAEHFIKFHSFIFVLTFNVNSMILYHYCIKVAPCGDMQLISCWLQIDLCSSIFFFERKLQHNRWVM